jgi:hypothetical protein
MPYPKVCPADPNMDDVSIPTPGAEGTAHFLVAKTPTRRRSARSHPAATGRTIEPHGFDMLFMMRLAADCINRGQFPDVYRPVCADCIAAIRSSICRVRCGVMPSIR